MPYAKNPNLVFLIEDGVEDVGWIAHNRKHPDMRLVRLGANSWKISKALTKLLNSRYDSMRSIRIMLREISMNFF